jgi:hypothetical protein
LVTSNLSTHIIINPLCPHQSGPPKISYPPYLPNGEQLWSDFSTIGFRTLENGGVGHFKTQKKKPNFGGNTHVTLNPKTLNPKPFTVSFKTLENGGVGHLETLKFFNN